MDLMAGDPALMILARLDTMNQNIRELIEVTKQSVGGQAAVNVAGQDRLLLETLVAASLPASPRDTHPVTVGTIESPLAVNESQALLVVDITNNDVAQGLWIGNKGVLVSSGRVVRPRTTTRLVLGIGKKIWGICQVATISVRVSEGYDLYAIVVR